MVAVSGAKVGTECLGIPGSILVGNEDQYYLVCKLLELSLGGLLLMERMVVVVVVLVVVGTENRVILGSRLVGSGDRYYLVCK